ncbi:sugar phosphate isomerase/epimerase family protein [Neptuniibacter sp. QD29_5]|uniref:sugar phosphate isomerase/epimerase family protein n=1 Tax=Neptuniibacter sp. QD29_5 TaxID=3398207 RepID=UPI0039F5CFC4
MNVFISNGFLGGSVVDSVALLHNAGIDNVELSSGHCDSDSLVALKKLHNQGKNFRLHNYFPNIGSPFVLNLSSADSEVRARSRELVCRALEWSAELESDYYAFHAGFRLSPAVSELGGNLTSQQMISVEDAKQYFSDELTSIAERAQRLGVDIAIENNVYDARNYGRYGADNPFLLCGDQATDMILPQGVGILLDVGHLKVAAQSLGFDPLMSVNRWKDNISGYHISDNDGLTDSNSHISEVSWFWAALNQDIKRVTLEVYDRNLESLKHDASLLESAFR